MRRLHLLLAAVLVVVSCSDASPTGPAGDAASTTVAAVTDSPESPVVDSAALADLLGGGGWRVVEVDGVPIFDGPGLGGSAGELGIGGCLLGSELRAVVNSDGTLGVAPDEPLADLDCDPSPTPVDLQRQLGEIVFGSPAIEVVDDGAAVHLVSEAGTLHLRAHADAVDLHGEWEVRELNREPIGSDLRLVFGQLDPGGRSGALELRACGAVAAEYRYDFSGVFDGGDSASLPTCEGVDADDVERVAGVLRRVAVLLELADGRADYFDGTDRLQLSRRLALGPLDAAEVFVLPVPLPAGFEFDTAEPPSASTHPTFVGAVTMRGDIGSVRLSLRWTDRPGWLDVDESSAGDGTPVERGGRTVYTWDDEYSGKSLRVPITTETNVWLTFDTAVSELPGEVVDELIGSLQEAPEQDWLALVRSLTE